MSLRDHLQRHGYALFSSLGSLARTPLSTLMTVSVIAIAFSLPAALYVLLTQVQALSTTWREATEISLFLKTEINDHQVEAIAKRIRLLPGVGQARVISRDQALRSLSQDPSVSAALGTLEENPLPTVVVVRPAASAQQPHATEALLQRLQRLSEVDFAQLDMQWVKRLHTLLDLAQRGVSLLAGLLALGVLIVVSNTIRLHIHARRDEIEVMRLIGATDGFIRRPFLYAGGWYGLFGGLVAALLVAAALALLAPPIKALAQVYDSHFEVSPLPWSVAASVCGAGLLLGWMGAWWAVGQHLRALERG